MLSDSCPLREEQGTCTYRAGAGIVTTEAEGSHAGAQPRDAGSHPGLEEQAGGPSRASEGAQPADTLIADF